MVFCFAIVPVHGGGNSPSTLYKYMTLFPAIASGLSPRVEAFFSGFVFFYIFNVYSYIGSLLCRGSLCRDWLGISFEFTLGRDGKDRDGLTVK